MVSWLFQGCQSSHRSSLAGPQDTTQVARYRKNRNIYRLTNIQKNAVGGAWAFFEVTQTLTSPHQFTEVQALLTILTVYLVDTPL